jgi:5-formyltetrahydrofolate cyclo-ligase
LCPTNIQIDVMSLTRPPFESLTGPDQRRSLRAQLLLWRTRMSQTEHNCWSTSIAEQFLLHFKSNDCWHGKRIGVYFPIKNEPKLLTSWLALQTLFKCRLALPIVVEKNQALQFAHWDANPDAGQPMATGLMHIPEPKDPIWVECDLLIAPCVGFDEQCFRLGYGGGYYDRTLAAQNIECWGLAYDQTKVASLHPQLHDRPMQAIVTQTGPRRPVGYNG